MSGSTGGMRCAATLNRFQLLHGCYADKYALYTASRFPYIGALHQAHKKIGQLIYHVMRTEHSLCFVLYGIILLYLHL